MRGYIVPDETKESHHHVRRKRSRPHESDEVSTPIAEPYRSTAVVHLDLVPLIHVSNFLFSTFSIFFYLSQQAEVQRQRTVFSMLCERVCPTLPSFRFFGMMPPELQQVVSEGLHRQLTRKHVSLAVTIDLDRECSTLHDFADLALKM